jgi:hypothetical protein
MIAMVMRTGPSELGLRIQVRPDRIIEYETLNRQPNARRYAPRR